MDTVRYQNFEELGVADFVFPLDGDGYIKLYEPDDHHIYSVDEINTILGTEWWHYVLTTHGEFLFFGTPESQLERNTAAEAYMEDGKVEFYGNVLVAHVDHVGLEELLHCKINLEWREYVLQRNRDVFYPVAMNRKSREWTPDKGKFYGLEELQKLVGGLIELVTVDNDHYVVCHEEELLKMYKGKDVVFNMKASILAQKMICGPAFLVKKSRIQ